MKILHTSFECHPIAKVGGLADVVGSLPKYQSNFDVESFVVMPFYENSYLKKKKIVEIKKGAIDLNGISYQYVVYKFKPKDISYSVYLIQIKDLLDTENVYGYINETQRYIGFQKAVLDWIKSEDLTFDVIHCHDHHTSLIPFFIKHCSEYKCLENTPTVLTIHNAQYQGQFAHDSLNLLPQFDFNNVGLLDWYGSVNPLAAGIKCATKVNTVSPSYMEELKKNAAGLEGLLSSESDKFHGILNGIDTAVWNPETDGSISKNYRVGNVISGKKANKTALCKKYGLDPELPLFGFIGRLVYEKSADLLADVIRETLLKTKELNIFVLGSGNEEIEAQILELKEEFKEHFNAYIGYDEELSHLIYAGADFLLMPSRVEPCGLNQMYSLRYGTIPIVRRTGGLKDTVVDIGDGGFGICHNQATIWDISYSIGRAIELFKDQKSFRKIQKQIMKIDNSWDKSAKEYVDLYKSI
ncbi:starch synthase [Tenacibaculum sp. MAR_2009_124]|uniref:glycogen synthase n=1 Tax=Tenacibaculum sp. MAR_2009_124 TaxID=1250059 RepID=UPI00089940BC|nr:glycogen/starch synthase [Tenacibaculum sp. MAR_2009_124]SEB34964.1 starch synthase [Tenacibaculum sp. MAR_2009_124]